jgi:putative ATP-dependent endonuclease of the OLD family
MLAIEFNGQDSVMAVMDNALSAEGQRTASEAKLGADRDSEAVRRILGKVAKAKSWFKDITRGERLAATIAPFLPVIPASPLVFGITAMRSWVDGQ